MTHQWPVVATLKTFAVVSTVHPSFRFDASITFPLIMPETEDHLQSRKDEIFALSSIYDELQVNPDELSGSLRIPVELDVSVGIVCAERDAKVRYLPGINFTFATGEKYPESEPPEYSIACSWLSKEKLEHVEAEIRSIWEGTKELCLFTMIDEISELAKSLFGMEYLEVSDELFEEMIHFTDKEELDRFQQGSYFCGVCLEHKRGVDCFKLPRCGHVFCKVLYPLAVSLTTGMSSRLLRNVYYRRSHKSSHLYRRDLC